MSDTPRTERCNSCGFPMSTPQRAHDFIHQQFEALLAQSEEIANLRKSIAEAWPRAARAEAYADEAARELVRRVCVARKSGWLDIGIGGPFVSPALDYLQSRGLLERHPKGGKVRLLEAPK